jgi:aspartate racemase
VTRRILGIVGGTGPESNLDYYRRFIDTWRRRVGADSYPRLIVNSIEGRMAFGALQAGDWDGLARIVATAIGQLAAAGAGAAMIASNATHLALDALEAPLPIPLIHIVHATRDAALTAGHRRLGIIGTSFIMQSRLYPDRLAPAGIELVTPNDAEREYVHDKYGNELVAGTVLDETRAGLENVVATMRDRDGIDGIILGGTELALIVTEATFAGIPVLNTAQIHVDAGIDWLLATWGGWSDPFADDPRVSRAM